MKPIISAELLYSTYCAAVGGVAFNGDPLPAWDDFRVDPAKAKQADAWEATAAAAMKNAEAMTGDRTMIDAAVRLRAVYGLDVRVTFRASSKPSFTTGATEEFWISGGEYNEPEGPQSLSTAVADTLLTAEEEFHKGREKLSKIDPLAALKKQAEAVGMELVPAARPLDLQPCKDA